MNERQGNVLERIVEFLIIIAIAYAIASLFAQDIAISLGADETTATIVKWVCFFGSGNSSGLLKYMVTIGT